MQVTPHGDSAAVAAALRKLPYVRTNVPVRFANVRALSATSTNGQRTTGRAFVVALPPAYAATFPGEIRFLLGAHNGVLLLQQTAANLAVSPGARIQVAPYGAHARALTVDGVVEMPAADSFFQVVGAPPGAGATAPPDNVVLVSPSRFNALVGSATVVQQYHVGLDHSTLPTNPSAAVTDETGRALHFEAVVAGAALVGDNLGTSLGAAREDAIYADLLFLLLGLPGVVLAAVVVALVVALRAERRRREAGLLRLRGATPMRLMALMAGETLVTGVLGAALGLAGAKGAVAATLPAGTPIPWTWAVVGAALGIVLAGVVQLGPHWSRQFVGANPGSRATSTEAGPCARPGRCGWASTPSCWRRRRSSSGVRRAAATRSWWRRKAWQQRRSTTRRCLPPRWRGPGSLSSSGASPTSCSPGVPVVGR